MKQEKQMKWCKNNNDETWLKREKFMFYFSFPPTLNLQHVKKHLLCLSTMAKASSILICGFY